tara:strand:- start:358 stop:1518 length:1161 start_codon:yes stop_codon:yes gene_type:complete
MLKIILIIILLIGLIKLENKENYKNQFCKLSHYDNKKLFTPINMILNNLTVATPFNLDDKVKYINQNVVLSIQEINSVIKNIPIKKSPVEFKQLKGVRYNLLDPPKINTISDKIVKYLPNELFKVISNKLAPALKQKTLHCNKNTKCKLVLKDSRILKVGFNKNKVAVEGQLLVTLDNRNIDFLFRYVLSDLNTLSIYYLKLEGYDISKYNSDKKYDYVNIYSEPIVNKYNADKTYLISSNETKILNNKTRNKIDERLQYRCYGKTEFNKIDCEAKYDSFGKVNKQVGIWDRPCTNNNECPFYKANKNYKNNLGGCINNRCQMPIGLKTKGPMVHKSIKFAICSNCKKGVNCCKEQQNRNIYPKLKSPDYRFQDDTKIRMNSIKVI